MTLERGTLINNRYRIVEILGQGGMGSVYRAVDENLGVEVAVKENLFTTEEYARQFRREAVILAALRHPNMPRVTDHFVIENQGQYLVMDYIEGEDLRQRMDRVGVITEEEAIMIGAAVCDALSFLDSRTQPIVHRDIKPGNIKITPQGQIYLVDFGLAKILEGSHVTTTGARAMTPGYSPPEQYGTARTDNRSDIFSLGATLYAALTGSIPEDALARAMEQVELTTVRKRNPKISRRMAAALERALEIRPDDRYQTAEEFKQSLLSVRSISRRRTGEYTVPPPPEQAEQDGSQAGGASGPESAGSGNPGSRRFPSSPLPLQVSTPLAEPVSSVRGRSRRRRGSRLWALGLIALLFLGTAFVYTYYSNITGQALARLLPGLPWRPALVETQPVAMGAAPTITFTPTPTDTPTPTSTATLTPTEAPTLPAAVVVPTRPSPTPLPTSVGGGDGMIAWASDTEGVVQIWVAVADSVRPAKFIETAEQITTNVTMPEGACQPDWSPDGKRLVFISPCSRNQELYPGASLYLVNVESKAVTPLTTGLGGDFDPAWSPDGKKIAFTSMRNSGRPRIYVINLDDGSFDVLSEQFSRDSQPAWSPDGKEIAFVSSRKGLSQIWIMEADGGNQRLFSQSGAKNNWYPDWSLDGQTILFTQIDDVRQIPTLATASYMEQVYNEFQYRMGPIPAREGRYSPDGFWVVFESWPEAGNHDIYIIAAGGAIRTQLTTSLRPDFDPVWKPLLKP